MRSIDQKLEEEKKRSSADKKLSNLGNFARVEKICHSLAKFRKLAVLAKFHRVANLAASADFFLYFFLSLPNLSLCNSDSILIFL